MNYLEIGQMFEGCQIVDGKIIVNSDLHNILKTLAEKSSFKTLKDITAVDWRNKGIELTYNLYSDKNEESVLLTIYVKDEAESVIDIFKSAIADENEIYDLFGIKFIGNDRLKRLYMPQDWEGSPLKKDYVENDSRIAWNEDNFEA